MPPAIALSFGGTVVALALWGKNAEPQPASEVPVEPEPAELVGDEPPPELPEADLPLDTILPESPPAAAEGYDILPDGRPVPELPQDAPKSVKFGVILFEYEGVQTAPGQKNPRSRTKDAARKLAQETLELARKDFTEAVEKGDSGSSANAGSVPRGVLEPSVEYILFTLEKGTLHPEPIETPRGYWIVRRIQ